MGILFEQGSSLLGSMESGSKEILDNQFIGKCKSMEKVSKTTVKNHGKVSKIGQDSLGKLSPRLPKLTSRVQGWKC